MPQTIEAIRDNLEESFRASVHRLGPEETLDPCLFVFQGDHMPSLNIIIGSDMGTICNGVYIMLRMLQADRAAVICSAQLATVEGPKGTEEDILRAIASGEFIEVVTIIVGGPDGILSSIAPVTRYPDKHPDLGEWDRGDSKSGPTGGLAAAIMMGLSGK